MIPLLMSNHAFQYQQRSELNKMDEFSYSCALDSEQQVSENKSAVTLITDSGGTIISRGKHVQILCEQVDNEGNYRACIYHMTGMFYLPFFNVFSQCGEHIKCSDVTKKINMTQPPEIRYANKTKTFVLEKRDVELMIERIHATSNRATFNILGRHSFFALPHRYIGRMQDNCFTWAMDKIYFAGIKFPAYFSKMNLFAEPSITVIENAEYSQDYDLYDLSKFAKEGADEVIRRRFPKSTNVNCLVSAPYSEGPVEFTLKEFTPLSLAIAYQRFSTVKMLVEEYNADLSIVVGMKRNYTASDCARTVWWGGVHRKLFCHSIDDKIISFIEKEQALDGPKKMFKQQ